MLRTWLALGSTLVFATAACGSVSGGNDDAAPNGTDAPVNQVDAPVGAADAAATPDGAIASCSPATGTTLTRTLVGNFVKPVLATAPQGDSRLFVVEQSGRIRIVKAGVTLATPFLDIRSRVQNSGEQGLLGLAFHPDYVANGRFFVSYSRSGGDSVIAEYHAAPGSDVANTVETPVLTLSQPAGNHNGGMIEFSPNDGYLYIGFGDGGGSNDTFNTGQDLTSMLGTILRIDVNSGSPYGIPTSNPFVGKTGTDEIWAWGIRNPWRFSFDRSNGDLYIGDVGQGAREEINVQPAASTGGENYGWPLCEGDRDNRTANSCAQAGLTAPVATKTHGGNVCSITGGYVYRGSCMTDLQGWYFYGDYCSGQVWRFQYNAGAATNEIEITNQIGGGSISSFGQDGLGELYVVTLNGAVYKIGLP